MQSRVTALVVATNGAARLERTLEGLTQQTRKPDRIILVDNGSTDTTSAIFADFPADRIISTGEVLPFGAALKAAMQWMTDEVSSGEWLWLLTHDSFPEPEALEVILSTVQRAPSVAIAGPKITSWDRPDHIREIGQTLTRFGARWQLSTEELDQEQRDTQQDSLAVGPVGMLVQRQLWDHLGGFDPALTTHDDGLDLCVRARLAGYRVVVAPESRVRFAGDGVAGPLVSRKMAIARQNYRGARTAQLHRRLAYAPAWAVPFHWLSLLPLAIVRILWYLLRELPGRLPGEIAAAFTVLFSGHKVGNARRSLRSTRTVGWDAIRPLRVDQKTVRTQQMIDREAILARQGRIKHEAHFISTGGLSLLTVSVVFSFVLFYSFFSTTALSGAGLLPLSNNLGDLWASTQYGLQGGGAAVVGPAHPFNFVLAILGTLTFWQPSFSIVLLYFAAIPLSALSAWFWAARVTERPLARGFVGAAWMLSPTLLASLDQGRIAAVIVHILLPCLVMALMGARKSWSAAATSSLLLGIILACAPSLFPAAAVLFVVGLAFSGRGFARVITVAIAPVALYFPLAIAALSQGKPLTAFIDPGVQLPFDPATPTQLLLGFPTAGLAGWNTAFDTLGIGHWPYTIIVAVLVAPLGLLALFGVVFSRGQRAVTGLLLAGVGLASALLVNHFILSSVGAEPVGTWAGPSLSLYWFGLLSLAVATLTVLPKLSETVTALSGLMLFLAVVPVIISIFLGHGALRSADYTVPAVVRAAAQSGQDVGTLVLTPQPDGGVLGEIVRGTGATLDQRSTLSFMSGSLNSGEQDKIEVLGALLSEGSGSQLERLGELGINFVVLSDVSEGKPIASTPTISATTSRIQNALDNNSDVSSVGPTEFGDLWKVSDDVADFTPPTMSRVQETYGHSIWLIQMIVIAGLFLLALPTGAVVEKPPKKKKRKSYAGTSSQKVAPPPVSDSTVGGEASAEKSEKPSEELEKVSESELAVSTRKSRRATRQKQSSNEESSAKVRRKKREGKDSEISATVSENLAAVPVIDASVAPGASSGVVSGSDTALDASVETPSAPAVSEGIPNFASDGSDAAPNLEAPDAISTVGPVRDDRDSAEKRDYEQAAHDESDLEDTIIEPRKIGEEPTDV
ncbi:glycosyltransferase [Lysinibacter sp. HNR]|uniref:glycosyltransferase n=1 Tax=Lysinibacter sp. HNR TaxID=3031408 RepID=UPI002435DB0C|nr:glycosyltransferase [Lysinibacter sp. HNR]WGD38103.1 glycosyltransferase [Lysinibacter sp. HNR]